MAHNRFPDIDYSFRPDLAAAAESPVGRVKGRFRRDAIKAAIERGQMDEIPDAIFAESLDRELLEVVGRIDPRNMGGEYLPNLERQELEIARISFETTTYDVTSVRLKATAKGFSVSIVDEYETDFGRPRFFRSAPTMEQLVSLLDQRDAVLASLRYHMEDGFGFTQKDALSFVTVESELYPQLQFHYERVIKAACEAHYGVLKEAEGAR